MHWLDCYHPPDPAIWQGRLDSPPRSCLFQQIQFLDLRAKLTSCTHPTFALLGFACDEGIRRNRGRLGAAQGPDALKRALAPLPIHHLLHCVDAGHLGCESGALEDAQAALGHAVHTLLTHRFTPIILGGGHELAFGHYQGIAAHLSPQSRLGIVNFDAHFDMRPLLSHDQGSSGTSFLQIAQAAQAAGRSFHYTCIGIQPASNTDALFETARNYHVQVMPAETLHLRPSTVAKRLTQRTIQQHDSLYVSLCLDVFAAAYAPGVSAPQVMGVLPWQVIPLLRQLAGSGKVISYDLAELSPPHDVDSRTAKLAAALIDAIFSHHRSHSDVIHAS